VRNYYYYYYFKNLFFDIPASVHLHTNYGKKNIHIVTMLKGTIKLDGM
jgi:hypothetical protein